MGKEKETGRRNGLFIKADRKKVEGFTKKNVTKMARTACRTVVNSS